jgi:hypothetical protein
MNEIYTITISLAILVGIFILLNIFSMLGYFTLVLFLLVIVLYGISYYYPLSWRDWIPSIPWLTKKEEKEKEKTPLVSDTSMPDSTTTVTNKKKLSGSTYGTTAEESSPSLLSKLKHPVGSAADMLDKDQAFHVQGNFDYAMARSVCKAYGAQLATFDQIQKAHDKGAEWCDYGWSEDSMVLYPTQYKSWSIYKDTDDPQQCGIPGVNGGYNNDTSAPVGANCFGKRPQGVAPTFSYPKTKYEDPPKYTVSPFNYTSWSGF